MENFEKQFISLFQRIAPHYRRSEVFYDFITLSALDMYLVTYRDQAEPNLRERFAHAKARYSDSEFTQLAELLAVTVNALTQKRYDFLGSVFMNLNLGDGYRGQYFTPSHIADLMAKVTLQDCDRIISQQGFVTLSEPTCGSGVMVIGCVNAMFDAKYNPQQQLWVHCQDVDFTAAMMCYIQLSLLHIPACIVVGDTLLNETKIQMYTLAHLMGNWSHKLEQQIAPLVNSTTEKGCGNNIEKSVIVEDLSQISILDEIDDNELIFY
ncbi:SAM-dependent DNA methyltransferase [Histophilus somni]|uniref:Type I restriction-modification system methyltransferase subunit n=2 Tax=Pasteurellaceae TaxID=712 RepID=A0A3S4XPG9_MANHA|nr:MULTISPECIES: N-6 DNA methylase [Pasteurellaceae]ACA31453.1 putative type I restriction enzyme M subunit [Histophilus somni 2336]AHG73156.1 type I restriction enzyme M subunit [Mannheimia sp. USDA-ARS-USMARC-1261]AHG79482.1 type I restriction enzyme M subunit [Mannheimia varigena USDA-ARS-USMARC-1388]AUV65062.1 putative type I restriction modification system methyltransferase subunit [Histophilus somni]QEH12269.1 SAM-dependent DNA methyltransferase [Histophilus somni]